MVMSVQFGPFTYREDPPACARCSLPVGGRAYHSPACAHWMHAGCLARRVLEEKLPSCPSCGAAYPDEDLSQAREWMAASLEEEHAKDRARGVEEEKRAAERAHMQQVADARARSEVARLARERDMDMRKFRNNFPSELLTAMRTNNGAALTFLTTHMTDAVFYKAKYTKETRGAWNSVLEEVVKRRNIDLLSRMYEVFITTDLRLEQILDKGDNLKTLPPAIVAILLDMNPDINEHKLASLSSLETIEIFRLSKCVSTKDVILHAAIRYNPEIDLIFALIDISPDSKVSACLTALTLGNFEIAKATMDSAYTVQTRKTILSYAKDVDFIEYLLSREEFRRDDVGNELGECAEVAVISKFPAHVLSTIAEIPASRNHLQDALAACARYGHLEYFKILLPFSGRTEPLTLAAYNGRPEMVRYIIQTTQPTQSDRVAAIVHPEMNVASLGRSITTPALEALELDPTEMDNLLLESSILTVVAFAISSGATTLEARCAAFEKAISTRTPSIVQALVAHVPRKTIDKALIDNLEEGGHRVHNNDVLLISNVLLMKASFNARVSALVRLGCEGDRPSLIQQVAKSLEPDLFSEADTD